MVPRVLARLTRDVRELQISSRTLAVFVEVLHTGNTPPHNESLARSRHRANLVLPLRARFAASPGRIPNGTEHSVVLMLRHGIARTAHLDRFSWRAGFSLDAHGMLIGLRASDSVALPALRSVVPPGARASDASVVDSLYSLVVANDDDRMHVLYEDAHCTAWSSDLDELLTAFQSRLHFRVAVGARTRLFVHAGVVGWRGRAILIPGRTHTGKSSLVAALVKAGATYYSDEYAVLDDDGLVHPFARPLGIRDDAGRTWPVKPEALGANVGDIALPASTVVVTKYVAGAEWQPRQLSPGETVLALLENTLAVRSRPADALRILSAAAADVAGLHGDRGEATRLAQQLLAG